MPTEPGDWPAWLSERCCPCGRGLLRRGARGARVRRRSRRSHGGEFWLSSLLNETVIHGADAAYAAGRDVDVDADIAADLITNHLAMLTSPTWAAQRPESASALRGAGETLHWHATDEPGLGEAGEWFIERCPDGASWQARSGEADVSVNGPAKSLLLILTRRRQLTDETDQVSVDGDLDLVRHWIETPLTWPTSRWAGGAAGRRRRWRCPE